MAMNITLVRVLLPHAKAIQQRNFSFHIIDLSFSLLDLVDNLANTRCLLLVLSCLTKFGKFKMIILKCSQSGMIFDDS